MYAPIFFNIDEYTVKNTNYREVIYTNAHSQLVVMSLLPKQEIGMEIHDVDQFIRIEKGTGESVLNGHLIKISDGSALGIPAGSKHNIINTGNTSMKLYTIYSPPTHPDTLVEPLKE
jgi:mannose-6-phosphate isomerase-like protein (cupin superfamily)